MGSHGSGGESMPRAITLTRALGGVLALAGTVIALAVLVVRGLKTTTAGAGPGRFLLWLAHSE
jgi:hypothetical protein